MSLAVIGTGPAGCFVLACLPPERLCNIHVFDNGFIGGDMAKLYGCVRANLTRTELEKALRMVPRWASVPMPILEAAAGPKECPLLSDVCRQLQELMQPLIEQVHMHTVYVVKAQQALDGWILWANDGSQQKVSRVVLCTGATPRKLDMPRPTIPLEVALCGDALAKVVRAEDSVGVFGTSHSGTLVLRNLMRLGCRRVRVFYRGSAPFRWKRNHDSEGLKQESAAIADEIVARAWGDLTPALVRVDDSVAVVRGVMDCDYMVYAIGFDTRMPEMHGLNGQVLEGLRHDPATAEIAPGMWGFGIGFPSLYEKPLGGFASDVGFGGFIEHILRRIGTILAY